MKAACRLSIAAALAAAVSGCAELGMYPHAPPPPGPPAAVPSHAAPASPTPAAPDQKVVRVVVTKTVKCVPEDLGPPPAYPDSDTALLQAGGAADRYQLMAAGRILRQQRLQKLEEAVKRCRNLSR